MIKTQQANRAFLPTGTGTRTPLLLVPPQSVGAPQRRVNPEPIEYMVVDPADAWIPQLGGTAGIAAPPRTAAELRRDVLAALRSEPRLARSTIGVLTLESVVILSGYADTEADAALAERLAKSVEGVQCVIVHLAVRHPAGGRCAGTPASRPSTPF